MWDEYELTPNNVKDYKKAENVAEVQKRVNNLRNQIKEIGSVNIDSIKEYQEIKERYDFLCEQRLDLENSITKLKKLISEILNDDGQIFGVCFMNMFSENGWLDKIDFDCVIDGTLITMVKK